MPACVRDVQKANAASSRLAVWFLFLIVTTIAAAQLPTATVLGTVKDSTGAVVPAATVTVRNLDTGLTRTTQSDANGSYRFAAMPVGSYEVRAEHPGFRTEVRSNLTLAVGQEAPINFTLAVGAVEQTLEVTAEAPLVNTTTGSLGGLVGEQQVEDLPLNGRNYVDLTLLQPGVSLHQSASPSPNMAGVWFSANGAIPRSNYFLLDGAPMGNALTGNSSSESNNTLGIEGIREWRVVSNAISAEYGLRVGAQVTMVSKAGTNSFHGSLYEYLRNSALDARNFFDYPSPATKPGFRLPPFRRNQFGASVGGPLKKDKAFFFANYEELKDRTGLTTIDTVPGVGCRGGAGSVITSAACPQLVSGSSVTVAQVVAPLLALYPTPNLPSLPPGRPPDRFTFPSTQTIDEYFGQIRGDYIVGTHDSAFVRFTANSGSQFKPLVFPQFHDDLTSSIRLLTLSDTHTFSPRLVGTFRASFSRNMLASFSPNNITGQQYAFVPGNSFGTMNVGGLNPAFGVDIVPPQRTPLNTFTYSGDLFYSKGRHSFKFGTLINHYQLNMFGLSSVNGQVTFANLNSFLGGQTSNYLAASPGSKFDRAYRYNTLGFYVQDDFRVVPRLTLNLGVRYEFHTDVNEIHGDGSSLRNVRTDAAFTPGLPFRNPSLKDIGPRVGFAWDVFGDGKTAVRGGFGEMFDTANFTYTLVNTKAAQPPIANQSTVNTPATLALPLFFPSSALGKSVRSVDYNLRQTHMLSYNLTVERQLPSHFAVSLTYAGSRGLNLIENHDSNPSIPTVVNGQLFWPTATQPRFNPNWTTAIVYMASGDSWYNSLQFVVTKRLSKGLELNSAYSWQKLVDQYPGQGGGDQGGSHTSATTVTPNAYDQGPADWQVNQAWHLSAIYHLPQISRGNAFAGALLKGWWTSGILTAQSGLPFTVYLSSVRSRNGEATTSGTGDRPNRVAGRSNDSIISGTSAGCQGVAPGTQLGTVSMYFDPCAFTIQPAGFLGNAGRNILTAPGVFNLDFSLVKDTPLRFLGEGGKLEFRAELFNILNHANFSRPNMAVFAGLADSEAPLTTAGQITKTDTAARQIQFALKLLF